MRGRSQANDEGRSPAKGFLLKLLWFAGATLLLGLLGVTFGALMFLQWDGGTILFPIAGVVGCFLLGVCLWASAGRVFPNRWP